MHYQVLFIIYVLQDDNFQDRVDRRLSDLDVALLRVVRAAQRNILVPKAVYKQIICGVIESILVNRIVCARMNVPEYARINVQASSSSQRQIYPSRPKPAAPLPWTHGSDTYPASRNRRCGPTRAKASQACRALQPESFGSRPAWKCSRLPSRQAPPAGGGQRPRVAWGMQTEGLTRRRRA